MFGTFAPPLVEVLFLEPFPPFNANEEAAINESVAASLAKRGAVVVGGRAVGAQHASGPSVELVAGSAGDSDARSVAEAEPETEETAAAPYRRGRRGRGR